MSLAIGVDVGGTKTAVGAVDEAGRVVRSVVVPTPAQDGEALLDAAAAAVAQVRGDDPVVAVGVGAAGLVDRTGSTVMFAPHLDWDGVDVRAALEERTGLPVEVENDVAASAWAEHRFGAGRDVDPLLVVTVGTGLGGGIVIDGALLRGFTGASGEVGHMPFVPDGEECACGASGCWERYASGSALTRAAQQVVRSGDPRAAVLSAACSDDASALTGAMVSDAARDGDPLAVELFARIGTALGVGLAGVAAVLDPQRIVVGGGAGSAGELLLGPARTAFAARLIGGAHRPVPSIVPAECGEAASLIGSAQLARERFAGGR